MLLHIWGDQRCAIVHPQYAYSSANIYHLESHCTFSRTSGLGDHGPTGIQDVISNHVCNHICLGLELASLQVLQDTLDDLLQETEEFLGGTDNTVSTGPLFSSSSSEEN